ncbi:MAG: dockerin type I repeat-containing protein [Clostridia bacterium]
MKKTFTLFLILVLCFSITAFSANDDVTFQLSGGESQCDQSLTAILSITRNSGISGAAVNIIYDSKKVKLQGYSLGSSMNLDIVSVVDNKYGQIRFSFCSTKGFFRERGEILILNFLPVENVDSTSSISLKYESNAIAGTAYSKLVYSCNTASLKFLKFHNSLKSNYFDVDNENMLITKVPALLTKDEFSAKLEGKFVVDCKSEYIGTGTTVTLTDDGNVFAYTVVVLGDVDGNGKITPLDYILLRGYLIEISTLTDEYLIAADVNKDTKRNSTDYIYIRRHIIGILNIYN